MTNKPLMPSVLRMLLLGCLVPAVFAQTERRVARPDAPRRVALVIGNDAYAAMPLKNAVNDARVMAETLGEIGFDVTPVYNIDSKGLERAVRAFVRKLNSGDIAFFFYAGHGIQVDGENYLVPLDFDAADEVEAKFKSLPVELIQEQMEKAGAKLNLLVLDACRDNPFRPTRSGAHGLAAMSPARGTLVALATGPGRTASDNPGRRNGLFTLHLVEALKTPGLKLGDLFDRVREEVDRDSGGRQTPWVFSNVIGGPFYLNTTQSGTAAAPTATSSPTPTPGRPTELTPSSETVLSHAATTTAASRPVASRTLRLKATDPALLRALGDQTPSLRLVGVELRQADATWFAMLSATNRQVGAADLSGVALRSCSLTLQCTLDRGGQIWSCAAQGAGAASSDAEACASALEKAVTAALTSIVAIIRKEGP